VRLEDTPACHDPSLATECYSSQASIPNPLTSFLPPFQHPHSHPHPLPIPHAAMSGGALGEINALQNSSSVFFAAD
jgi:hypothetical protein